MKINEKITLAMVDLKKDIKRLDNYFIMGYRTADETAKDIYALVDNFRLSECDEYIALNSVTPTYSGYYPAFLRDIYHFIDCIYLYCETLERIDKKCGDYLDLAMTIA